LTEKPIFFLNKLTISKPGDNGILANRYIKDIKSKAEKALNISRFKDTLGEKWKYTDLKPLFAKNFRTASQLPFETVEKDLIKDTFCELREGIHVVIINGYFSKELSNLNNIPEGLSVSGFLYNNNIDSKPDMLGSVASGKNNSFLSLNSSLFEDYIIISAKSGAIIEQPVFITLISTGESELSINSPRIFIHSGEGSRMEIIEEYTGSKDTVHLTNSVTEILMENNSVLFHHKVQLESKNSFHIGYLSVSQKKNSTFNAYLSSFGGSISRNEITASINGESSECHLNGIYMLNGHQHIDNHTEIYHNSPDSSSSEKYHGILDGEAKAVFDGLIYVAKGAVKTDSIQSNNSLLISENATVDSKPTLEIYADDVKCSHSATVGQMDDESIYYLRSRGIGKKDAVRILTSGFADEIIEKFSIKPVKEKVSKILSDKLSEMKNE
jgi:Fe-S cluster assembly protein SufD